MVSSILVNIINFLGGRGFENKKRKEILMMNLPYQVSMQHVVRLPTEANSRYLLPKFTQMLTSKSLYRTKQE